MLFLRKHVLGSMSVKPFFALANLCIPYQI